MVRRGPGSPFALMFGTGDLPRRKGQNGLDRRATRGIDQLIHGRLRPLDEVHDGKQGRTLATEEIRERLSVLPLNDLVCSSHWWWLLSKEITTLTAYTTD